MNDSFEELANLAETKKRKLDHNTYLVVQDDGGYGIKLHDTIICTHYEDRVEFSDMDGYFTVTTKDRLNKFSGWQWWSIEGTWYCQPRRPWLSILGEWGVQTVFDIPTELIVNRDGMTVWRDGRFTKEGMLPGVTSVLDGPPPLQRSQIRAFAKDYMEAFNRGEVPAPGNGDCWGCLMVTKEGKHPMGGPDHIRSHILEETYYVPSLLANAVNDAGGRISPAARWHLAGKWSDEGPKHERSATWFGGVATDQLTKALVNWIYKEAKV